MASTSPLMPTVSTSSSLAEAHLLPSPSAIIPTTQSSSLLKIPIPTTTTTTSPGNNLNTSVSSLETETRSLTTSNKLATLSNETQQLVPLPESVPTTSNSEHSNAPEILQCVKRNPRNRRKRPKVQKPEIEIKMTPHRPRKSAPTEYATDEEDMITYDVEKEELEPDPTFKFAFKESSSMYGSARASVLKRLDTIHHSALIICSGALRTSPVTSLYVVCHQPPLELRRRQLIANYFILAMSVSSHPLKPFSLVIGLTRLYESRSFNIKPFFGKARSDLNDAP
ncbi:uncharacterized protein TNCV_2082951 [Trichonephila clavipes]|nr:uncharacterized protein TNCV_2082951 [Trichonephila clavipes]